MSSSYQHSSLKAKKKNTSSFLVHARLTRIPALSPSLASAGNMCTWTLLFRSAIRKGVPSPSTQHSITNIITQKSTTPTMEALTTTIQPLLQPITQNLPQPIADVGISLLGATCYKTLIYNVDLTATECVKLGISKGLGIGIIGASSIVKIPQLVKLLNSQSADGLSFLSYLLESSSYLISLAYNVRHGFPFSTYGETALILVQNIAIASLVLKYSGRGVGVAGWVGGLAVAGAALFNEEWVGEERLSLLQATAGVLGVASKVPQILTVWSEGGTGQLSAFAVSLSLFFFFSCSCVFFGLWCVGFVANARLMIRLSTTSLALSPASLLRCRKSTTRSFCTASALASHLTSSCLRKSYITGTRRRPRRPSPTRWRSRLRQIGRRWRRLLRVELRRRMRMLLERVLVLDAGVSLAFLPLF